MPSTVNTPTPSRATPTPSKPVTKSFPLRLSLIYAAVAVTWIAGSSVLAATVLPPGEGAVVEVAKGALFVLVTAGLLLVLASRFARERDRAEERLHLVDRALETITSAVVIVDATDPTFPISYVNPAFEAMTGFHPEEAVGRPGAFLQAGGLDPTNAEIADRLATDGTWTGRLDIHRRDGTSVPTEVFLSSVRDESGATTHLVAIAVDISDRVRLDAERLAADRERARLATAVEQAAESIVIAEPDGSIVYVNPAFERNSGYSRDEVIGRNPNIRKSGRHSAGFYRAMWATLTGGGTWAGRVTNRRKDGSLSEEETVISPVRDAGGQIVNYIAVHRDVTHELEIEEELEREVRLRSELIDALDRLQAFDGLTDIAAGICDEALGLPGIDLAMVLSFATPGVAVPLAARVPPTVPIAANRPLPASRTSYLRDRASRGPWTEIWVPRAEDGAYGIAMAEAGVQATAYAPLRSGRRLLGLIGFASTASTGAEDLARRLPLITEFTTAAGALLIPGLESDRRLAEVRERILATISTRAFHPVFQPVVELDGERVVGHEALTRFDDGTPPDQVFREADAVGLGTDLELACLGAALEAEDRLPAESWLSLNVSPELVLARDALAGLVADRRRAILLEITEHVPVADYQALREAVSAIGPDIRLSIDDAGAGFASLRHIVELRPSFVKLDIGLVRAVDQDPARQALIAGIAYFAVKTGCALIAEGIETEPEAKMLRSLAIHLGQGYLYARPAPIADLTDEPVATPGTTG